MAETAPTVVHDMIRSWKIARLSLDTAHLGLTTTSILGNIVEIGPDAVAAGLGVRRVALLTEDKMTDAKRVQKLVEQMPSQYRATFEAYHIGIIREESCRGQPHRARALILGISEKTYFRRVKWGWNYVRNWAKSALDW